MDTPVINDLHGRLEGLSREDLLAVIARMAVAERSQGAGGAGASDSRRTRRKKSALERIRYLSEEETAALFSAIRAGGCARDLAIFEVAYHRGLRASEIGLLLVGHVRLNERRIYVKRLKGSLSGEYPITDREVKALRRWMRERGPAAGPLFLSREHGAIGRRRLDQLMKHYGALAGVPEEKRHFHALKHTCGTHLMDRDVAVELVQDHLGHKDIRNTMIYAKVSQKKREQMGARLEKEW